MSIEKGRAYFRQFGMEERVIEFTVSSATVELAAKALGVEGARIAKSLSFKKPEGGALLVLAAGDARIDNHKFKAKFGFKPKMLSPDEVLELIGPPGGRRLPLCRGRGLRLPGRIPAPVRRRLPRGGRRQYRRAPDARGARPRHGRAVDRRLPHPAGRVTPLTLTFFRRNRNAVQRRPFAD